jgi:hypothetical protein
MQNKTINIKIIKINKESFYNALILYSESLNNEIKITLDYFNSSKKIWKHFNTKLSK